MKCPRCGHEMNLDEHRRYALNMCYECGYIEGRLADKIKAGSTNLERIQQLSFNEAVVFISDGLKVDRDIVADWLDNVEDIEE